MYELRRYLNDNIKIKFTSVRSKEELDKIIKELSKGEENND